MNVFDEIFEDYPKSLLFFKPYYHFIYCNVKIFADSMKTYFVIGFWTS